MSRELQVIDGCLRSVLRRDLALAIEHVYGIRWLIEFARERRYAVPSGALERLDRVATDLEELQRRLSEDSTGSSSSEERLRMPCFSMR
jgi:hypothetical protein